MQRLRPGPPQPLSCGTWGAFVDVADWYKRHTELGDPRGENLSKLTTDLVDVRNDTGLDCRAGEVVEIGDKIIDELTNDHLWFAGVEPNETRTYGILRKPVISGEIGRCQVSGVVKAYVNITDEAHKFAKVVAGATVLESAAQGAVEIVYKPSGEGEKECVVKLGINYEVFMGEAELAAPMCENGTIAITGFVGWTAGPCVIMPSTPPSTAENLDNRKGKSGDRVRLVYNSNPDVDDWEIVGVLKKTQWIIAGSDKNALIRLNDDKLEASVVEAAIEYCEDPAYEEQEPTTDCESEE